MNRITPKTAPVGSRCLVKDLDWCLFETPSEVVILEWSKGGRAKVQYTQGGVLWLEVLPFLVEPLPRTRKAKP